MALGLGSATTQTAEATSIGMRRDFVQVPLVQRCPMTPLSALDLELAGELKSFYDDPLGFVRFAFPWSEPGGPLEKLIGPDTWQREFLRDLGREVRKCRFQGVKAVKAIRMSVASGHGIGKSTLVAWIVLWIMSTRPNAKGTITASTRL